MLSTRPGIVAYLLAVTVTCKQSPEDQVLAPHSYPYQPTLKIPTYDGMDGVLMSLRKIQISKKIEGQPGATPQSISTRQIKARQRAALDRATDTTHALIVYGSPKMTGTYLCCCTLELSSIVCRVYLCRDNQRGSYLPSCQVLSNVGAAPLSTCLRSPRRD